MQIKVRTRGSKDVDEWLVSVSKGTSTPDIWFDHAFLNQDMILLMYWLSGRAISHLMENLSS